jgi:hypothetical protein
MGLQRRSDEIVVDERAIGDARRALFYRDIRLRAVELGLLEWRAALGGEGGGSEDGDGQCSDESFHGSVPLQVFAGGASG